MPTVLHQALQYLRRHGLRRTLRRVFSRFVHGSDDFIITRVDLAGPPALHRVGDIDLRLAARSDLQRLAELERHDRQASVLRGHVEDGDWVFVAAHGERIAAARVVTRAFPPHGIISKVLTLKPGQAWDDDMLCLPDFRGKGLARHLSVFSDRYMASLGYTEAFASISTWNTPSLRMHLHKGAEFAYHVSYRRFLFYKRLRVSRDMPPELMRRLKAR